MKKNILTFIAFVPSLVLILLFVSDRIVFDAPPVVQATPPAVAPSQAELEELRTKVKSRLLALEKMTKKDWEEEGKKLGEKAKLRAPSREEAIARHQKALKAIDEKIAATQSSM